MGFSFLFQKEQTIRDFKPTTSPFGSSQEAVGPHTGAMVGIGRYFYWYKEESCPTFPGMSLAYQGAKQVAGKQALALGGQAVAHVLD